MLLLYYLFPLFFVLKFGVKGREKFVEAIGEWKKVFILTIPKPAKLLNDAQMCGSFCFIPNGFLSTSLTAGNIVAV